ncbi:hypothetical protein F2Q70_00031469 [Brassica cretica]|uniref:Uncharacterized protein n=1 Tax=Brassica cretica TaxID=69181 RepID=A0A8S9FGN3_BRACR|nr:hypothetical protein F2Q70_00031469 [Brassica cretica]KAF2551198.1 hypothetical protein F2Q68_00035879 [Brassica cretica]
MSISHFFAVDIDNKWLREIFWKPAPTVYPLKPTLQHDLRNYHLLTPPPQADDENDGIWWRMKEV